MLTGPLYLKSWEDAKREGKESIYRESRLLNRYCAAALACAMQRNSYQLSPDNPAVVVNYQMVVYEVASVYGIERLWTQLALYVRQNPEEWSEVEINRWCRQTKTPERDDSYRFTPGRYPIKEVINESYLLWQRWLGIIHTPSEQISSKCWKMYDIHQEWFMGKEGYVWASKDHAKSFTVSYMVAHYKRFVTNRGKTDRVWDGFAFYEDGGSAQRDFAERAALHRYRQEVDSVAPGIWHSRYINPQNIDSPEIAALRELPRVILREK
ncbi:MAG: hypothetical protein FWF06_07165 [Symbiobacteriaceae bacterium]|nr:hypothetical protein [Symbiobacteriaceae bacterium]